MRFSFYNKIIDLHVNWIKSSVYNISPSAALYMYQPYAVMLTLLFVQLCKRIIIWREIGSVVQKHFFNT